MGIFNAMKKGLFGEKKEEKLMQTINSPVFLKDFVYENSNRDCQQTSNLCKGSDPCVNLPRTVLY